jgi:NRAMP (natural resistance-associated macrophage protein)-like metal ion transporter
LTRIPNSSTLELVEDVVKKIADSPAVALDQTVDKSKGLIKSFNKDSHIKRAKNYWKSLGPGLTTGAADDDPAGIATYSQTGAQYGFQLLWLAGFTFPLMSIVQEMCARIGLVTGRGLAGNIRIHYPKSVLYLCTILLFFANTLNIGANLGAMAKATQLVFPNMSFSFLLVFFTVLSLGLQIFISYGQYAKYLKYLAFVLLSYIATAFMIKLDWQEVLYHSVVPSITFSVDQIIIICAILGTTISPYLFFWQTSQEVEEKILHGKTNIRLREGASHEEIKRVRTDVWSGMFLSNLVMYFIIAVTAATLHQNGITNIATAADAARALEPIAGPNASLLFTLGIVGTGLLAIPILAGSTSYAMSESFKWKFGLYRKLKAAPSFYGIIMISTGLGFLMNFSGIDPIRALLYSAVANGLIAPIILFLIVRLSSNKQIMGKWVNGDIRAAFGWYITLLMAIVAIAALYAVFTQSLF